MTTPARSSAGAGGRRNALRIVVKAAGVTQDKRVLVDIVD